MDYSRIASAYALLEKTPAKLRKTRIIADILADCTTEELPVVTGLLQGRVFPAWSDKEIGIAGQLMIKALSLNTGFPEKDIGKEFRESGDLGLVAEKIVSGRKQSTLFRRKLTAGMVFDSLRKLAAIGGKSSQARKFQAVSEMVSSATPLEAKYIVRTILGDLRVGVAEGIIRDAIATAFFGELEGENFRQAVKDVEWAWFLRPDYGEVARIAKEGGLRGLRGVALEAGKPYIVLLAEKAPGLEDALEAYKEPVLEYKYDGARICIHKKGEKVWLFTRKLEDVTRQFPEVVEMALKAVKAGTCILEGEMVGMDRQERPLPFQYLSQRIKRKYDIERVMKDIPVVMNLFDITLLDGKVLFELPLRERRRMLESVVTPIRDRFGFSESIETRDIRRAERFYKKALSGGHEGLIVKNLDARYQPGRRVAGGWLKVKPTMENLDLVIIGATWGTGKRAGWLGSLILGCRDPETGEFPGCGMIGTGIKEKGEEGVTFDTLTRLLKPLVQRESGSHVTVRPEVVVEVAYEEIQKSTNYSSGYALRFPRVVGVREDRRAEDADTTERLERLFLGQRGRK